MEMRLVSRRVLLADLGRVTAALAVFGVAACADDGDGSADGPADDATSTAAPQTTTSTTPPAPPQTEAATASTTTTAAPVVGWERVVLGFVSAYVVVRDGEAAVVDTGNGGEADTIQMSLGALGAGWDDVGHVILTHRHNDHIGGLNDVLAAAPAAAGYAGAGDIGNITSPRPLLAVGDGDSIMGLDVIETPGHTPGHISLLDATQSLLIAGDAIFGPNTPFPVNELGVGESPPQFTNDAEQAAASVEKLAGLRFDSVVFGHGDPIIGGAADAVASLASG